MLLVFTVYLPKSHKLDDLGKKCGDLHPVFRDIFPRATPEDRARFELLEAAYVDARYSMTYRISRKDLDMLAVCVRVMHAHRSSLPRTHCGHGLCLRPWVGARVISRTGPGGPAGSAARAITAP